MSLVGTKLDPFYWHLRGFDRRGATIAYTQGISDPTEYKVSGLFSDLADFAVLQWDIDDFFGHLNWKYLPDFDLDGIILKFDVRFNDFQSISSPKFQSVPWRNLSFIREDGSSGTIDLFANALRRLFVTDLYSLASSRFDFEDNGAVAFDRVTLWYNNTAFDHIVANPPPSDILGTAINDLESQINNANWNLLSPTLALFAAKFGNSLIIHAANFGTCNVSGTTVTRLTGEFFSGILPTAVIIINGISYNVDLVTNSNVLELIENAGNQTNVSFLVRIGGLDGNHIEMYSIYKNNNLKTTQDTVKFSGGKEEITWKVTLDFAALGISSIRKIWFTYAPILTDGNTFSALSGSATYSNWSVTSTKASLNLRIAGPNSVTINHDSVFCCYTGTWTDVSGFFNQGFSRNTSIPGSSVTITYNCSFTHDLYLGTQLYIDKGVFTVRLDSDIPTNLNMFLDEEPPVNTRRLIRSNVVSGEHTLVLTLQSADPATPTRKIGLFDFIQAIVPSNDFPVPLNTETNVGLASDYDTNHSFSPLPARVVKNIELIGLTDRINHFVGVFFALTRRRRGGSFSTLILTFTNFVNGDSVFVTVGGTTMGKSVFPADTDSTIARHFKMFINHTFVGIWASVSGNTLTIATRTPINGFTHSVSWTSSTGFVSESGDIAVGIEGDWEIDPNPNRVLNSGATDWHIDYFKRIQDAGLDVIATYGHEFVNPPDTSTDTWIARFKDGTAVTTATGFSNLSSNHGAFSDTVLLYELRTYLETIALLKGAGLAPKVQLGEKHFWFFAKGGTFASDGMAFFDQTLKDKAQTQLGRELFDPSNPFVDPNLHQADANLLRDTLNTYLKDLIGLISAFESGTQVESLYAYDVNQDISIQNSFSGVGGRYNFYINTPIVISDFDTTILDLLKVEALAHSVTDRDNNKARIATLLYKTQFNWPSNKTTYLMPIFNGGCPWQREYRIAKESLVGSVNLFAIDHALLFSWPEIALAPTRAEVR